MFAGLYARLSRWTQGSALIALGVFTFAVPLTIGLWSPQFLSIIPFVVGLGELYETVMSPSLRGRPSSYAIAFLSLAAALILYVSPSLVLSGVVIFLHALLIGDGILKIGQARAGPL